MDGFSWENAIGEQVKMLFSLIGRSYWLNDNQDSIVLTYDGEEDYAYVDLVDLEDEDGNLTEYGQTLWPLLLQYSGLDAS